MARIGYDFLGWGGVVAVSEPRLKELLNPDQLGLCSIPKSRD